MYDDLMIFLISQCVVFHRKAFVKISYRFKLEPTSPRHVKICKTTRLSYAIDVSGINVIL